MNNPATNMETIREVFQAARVFCSAEESLEKIAAYCENADKEFRSIAYEAASMSIALRDLEKDISLKKWRMFADTFAESHLSQVYAGLGWAVAQQSINLETVIKALPTLYRYRVADGCGYYDGTFRNRLTVRNKQVPTYVSGKTLIPYFQGVGRSLWYITKGDSVKTVELLLGFPPEYHGQMWRGAGTAVTYVGGSDDATLKQLVELSGNYKPQLLCGVAFAVYSRSQANCMTPDAEAACNVICGLPVSEVVQLILSLQPPAGENNDDAYFKWLEKIEQQFKA